MEVGEIYIAQKNFKDIRVEKGDEISITGRINSNRFTYKNLRTNMTSFLNLPCRLIAHSKRKESDSINYFIY